MERRGVRGAFCKLPRDSLSLAVTCIKKTGDYVDIGYIGYNKAQGRMALFDPSGKYIAAFLEAS